MKNIIKDSDDWAIAYIKENGLEEFLKIFKQSGFDFEDFCIYVNLLIAENNRKNHEIL